MHFPPSSQGYRKHEMLSSEHTYTDTRTHVGTHTAETIKFYVQAAANIPTRWKIVALYRTHLPRHSARPSTFISERKFAFFFFATAAAVINPQSRSYPCKIIRTTKKNFDRKNICSINITVHTTIIYLKILSLNKAIQILNHLISRGVKKPIWL